METRAIAFDIANTLLHKNGVIDIFYKCAIENNYQVSKSTLAYHHHLLKENIVFPDVTTKDFYDYFNKEVFYSLGINPSTAMLSEVYEQSRCVSWEPYSDIVALKEIALPLYVYSNFNNGLSELIKDKLGVIFDDIIVSEEVGASKPSKKFYRLALERTKVKPEEILYIGDSFKLDYIPATALGIRTVLIDRFNYFPARTAYITNLFDLQRFIL